MASADVDIELEDGEINDLEDGEIDEDILLSTESSNNVFSRLEPRQDLLRDGNNSYGVNNRDFVFHKSGPSPGRWEPQRGSSAPATRARFPRDQKRGSPATLRGSRGKAFRGNGRGMMVREKSFLAKRGDSRRSFLQRPNLPHPPSAERSRPGPYLDKRVPSYPDNDRPRLPHSLSENRLRPPRLDERWETYTDTEQPRLPHPSLIERQRIPLKELDEKSWPSHNEMADSVAAVTSDQPERTPSPLDEEEVDDYRILLQRHRLIQQQLAALEKQENSTLGEDNIIDDTFIDIPVEDTQPDLLRVNERDLQNFSNSLDETYEKEDVLNSQELNIDRNATSIETSNEIYSLEKSNDLLESEQTGEAMAPKAFSPFKIKPRYSNLPSIKELSQKDLEQREAGKYIEPGDGSNDPEYLPIKEKRTRAKKNRGRKRKRKLPQGVVQSNTAINSQPFGTVGLKQGSHVDPYNELEARLMSLAGSSVPNLAGTDSNREDRDKQRERRERLRQWQKRMNKEIFPDQKNQQEKTGRSRKKLAKGAKGDKRGSSLQSLKLDESQRGDRDLHRRAVNASKFERDDYFEIPMEVESDSTDGPALPLIEEPAEEFPPPPPPLPNGDSSTSMFVEHGQHELMMYPPGYFHVEQNYPDWSLVSAPVMSTALDDQQFRYEEHARHPADEEGIQEQRNSYAQDTSSQDNSDEDDEAALREQLLKSLAVKRKAKLGIETDTKSSGKESASASPRVQSPVTVTNKEQQKKQQNSRQVSFVAPPKHDPVVIKLGEDSDTEESDASDTESAKKTTTNTKASVGGLFGGLEMMIKEARKSAEASKVKESQNVKVPQADTGEPAKTDLPAVPKTPDAMDHMPEQMKTEYRRLKEQLAMREKTRQPLTNVNQEKGGKENSSQSVASEDQTENTRDDNSSHLRELHSYVTGCEENLSEHKKYIQKDGATLAKMLKELKDKSQSLEVQEANVRKLQQQLEAAQKVTLANRMLVRKLRSHAKMVKETVTKKQLAASNFEEELLRAKSILSAVKRKIPTAVGDTGSGRNSPQLESLGSVGNENQKLMITTTISEQIKSSLATKLNKLSNLSKLENSEKRKLEGISDSSEETVAKKARPPTIPSEGSPASSAPSTPRKSAKAEHIAQEKARLKKLERELSEKLKLYGRQEEKKNNPSASSNKQSQTSECDSADFKRKGTDKNQLPQHSGGVSNSSGYLSEKQEQDSREEHTHNELPGSHQENLQDVSSKDSEASVTVKVSITPEQLERIRTLQAEKEKKGPQFSASSLDMPVAAHQRSILCVCLPFGGDLTSIVADQDTGSLCGNEQGGVKSVAGEITRKDSDEIIPCPLEKYQSRLLHFKSYRLSPYFRIEGGFSLTSPTFSNKLRPAWPLCNFDLQGKCNDEDCNFQHFDQCKLSKEQTLQDLASYNPVLTAGDKELKEVQESVESFTKAFVKQYQEKMSWEELCILLVNHVKKQRKGYGPLNVSLQPRTWTLKQLDKKQEEYNEESVRDLGRGIMFSRKDRIHAADTQTRAALGNKARPASDESQDVRYFSEEIPVESSPGDVALWIKIARSKLHQSNAESDAENEDTDENNVTQALSTLSRGLEENTQSEELWLEYLELYSSQCTQDELREICDQAVEFSPTYSVWWKYLEYSETYHAKRTLCLRLISFLVTNPVDPVELHSHRILETLLYLVQLELYSGHYKLALSVFKAALTKKAHNSTDVVDVSNHLLPSDCCLAWLAYIHVFEFHRLPAPWFDPCHGKPSRMVTKEDFVFPWKPSQQSRAPGEKLLAMFQDALKACRALMTLPSSRLSVCLPLYKNLIALERAYGRINSARGICRHLLKGNPSVVVLWLCLAALEDAVEDGDAGQVYEEALGNCMGHAELSYSAARYYLEKSEVPKALSVLVKCVKNKFASASKSPEGEVLSLAATSPEHEGADPVALYRRLLSQPLPYDYKCPPLMPGVTPQSLGSEKLYLWLSYCLLLEISVPSTTIWDNLTPESAFETGVHSPLDRQDVQTLWTEYVFYQRSKALQKENSSTLQQSMTELVNRCLMSVSTSSSLPHSSSTVWQDYRFHNQVICMAMGCQPWSSWSALFEKYLKLFPGSVSLALWAISIELQRNCVKEARKMYQQATEILPFAATLWKDFLMFELAQSGDGPAVQEIVVKSREIGVDLEDFLKTLLGK